MTISRRVSYLFTAVAFVFSATLASAQVEWNHDPDSAIGPNLWGSLTFPFATCGAVVDGSFVEVGRKQAPVNIVTADTVAAALPALVFQYKTTAAVVENTGHVVEVPYEPGSAIRVGQDTYDLSQFHFHAPSEHTVNGQFAAAELHLVHRNALLDLAVVGVLVNVGSPVNTVIDEILRNASTESGEEVDLGGSINAKDVLPQFKSYYTYSGSLTTPPCSEGVRWFVLKEPVFVSQAAIDHLHDVISEFTNYEGFRNNNRPVRPLNGRVILNRNGR
jgi:carbonic anhydrase